MLKRAIFTTAAATLLASQALAAMPEFSTGPVFTGFGPVAAIASDMPIPKGTVFKLVFDVSAAAEPGTLNRSFESAARFINMTVAAGVPLRDVHVAVVVHGKAAVDLLNDAAYAKRNAGKTNASVAPIAEMLTHNIDFYLCGQTATAASIAKTDLVNGVKLSLSAMTATALLQQAGYTLNP